MSPMSAWQRRPMPLLLVLCAPGCAAAKSNRKREKVDMRLYRVIYQAIEDVEAAMKGMLNPIFEEQIIGHAVIRQTFKASGVGTIAGSYILDGKFQRGCKARLPGTESRYLTDLWHPEEIQGDDVKEVNAGYECGLVFEKIQRCHRKTT